jgi:ferredoxin
MSRLLSSSFCSALFIIFCLAISRNPVQAFFGGGGTVTKVEMKFDNGKTVTVDSGTPLKDGCAKAGAKIQYGCGEGKCNACVVKLNGAKAKPCIAKVPNKKSIDVVTTK